MGLDAAEMVMDVEDEFKIEIPDVEGKIDTVGELHLLIIDELRKQNRDEDGDEVFEKLRQLIAAHQSIPVDKITPDTRFVEDLGLN